MVVGQSHDKSRKEVVLSIAHCGPIAEIVSRKLLSLFVVSKSKSSKAPVRVASVRSFGDDVASVDAFLEEVRKLTDQDIADQIDTTRRELFDLRFQQATRQLSNTHRFKEARVQLAQLLTVQNERLRSSTSTSS